MALGFEQAEQKWAAERFAEAGKAVRDGDTFVVDEKTFYGGYCETCFYEFVGLEITNTRTGKTVNADLTFRELVSQLVESGDI